jgi:hypothetical protein
MKNRYILPVFFQEDFHSSGNDIIKCNNMSNFGIKNIHPIIEPNIERRNFEGC